MISLWCYQLYYFLSFTFTSLNTFPRLLAFTLLLPTHPHFSLPRFRMLTCSLANYSVHEIHPDLPVPLTRTLAIL